MKKQVFLVLSLISLIKVNAQFHEKTLVYGSFEASFGNYHGVDFNINYIYQNKYSFKIGYSGFFGEAKAAPKDIDYNVFGPNDAINSVHLVLGRVLRFKELKNTQLNIGVGIAYIGVDKPKNFVLKNPYNKGIYYWDNDFHNEIGVVFNPKIELFLNGSFGVTVSPLAQYSKHSTYVGIGVGILFRLVPRRKVSN